MRLESVEELFFFLFVGNIIKTYRVRELGPEEAQGWPMARPG